MKEKSHRRKVLLLFLSISIFAIFASKKAKNFTIEENIESKVYTISESTQSPVNQGELVQDVFIEVDENLNPTRYVYPEVVLSETTSTQCRTTDLVYSSDRICSAEPVNFPEDLSDDGIAEVGTVIKKDAKISLVSIEVPPLFSGSPTMDTSVRQIYRDSEGHFHWTLKPAGEMVSRRVVEYNAAPGDEKTKKKLDDADRTRNKPFGMEYSIEVSGEGEGGGKNRFTVDEYYPNDCGAACDNPSSGTLEKYQVVSEILASLNEAPGYYDNIEEEEEQQSIESCSGNSRFLDMNIQGTSPEACTPTLKEIIVSFTKKIQNIVDQEACNPAEGETADCVSTANIVVVMESPWGTKKDCAEKGQCVNEFNKNRNGYAELPGGDSGGTIYVLTDCIARIQGVGEKNLRCAWDIDYIAKELQFQSFDNLPGEEYPDTMDYLNFHIDEAENREEQPLKM